VNDARKASKRNVRVGLITFEPNSLLHT
jgi:hypothetical protein